MDSNIFFVALTIGATLIILFVLWVVNDRQHKVEMAIRNIEMTNLTQRLLDCQDRCRQLERSNASLRQANRRKHQDSSNGELTEAVRMIITGLDSRVKAIERDFDRGLARLHEIEEKHSGDTGKLNKNS